MLEKLTLLILAGATPAMAQAPAPATQRTLPLRASYTFLTSLAPGSADVTKSFGIDGGDSVNISVLGSSRTMAVSLIDPVGLEHAAGAVDGIVSACASF